MADPSGIALSFGPPTKQNKPAEPQLDFDKGPNPIEYHAKYLGKGQSDVALHAYAAWHMDASMDDNERLQKLNIGPKDSSPDDLTGQEGEPFYSQLYENMLQSLPAIADSIEQGAVGAAGGAAAGAAYGAAGGTVALPFVGTGVGALGGGGIGAEAGFTAGMFKSNYEQAAGEMYMELRKQDVNHETARNVAHVVGAVNGALFTASLGSVKALAGRALLRSEKAVIMKGLMAKGVLRLQRNMLGRAIAGIAEGTTVQTVLGTQAAINKQLGEVAAGLLQSHNPEAFTNWGEAANTVRDAFIGSIMAGGVLSTVGHVAGAMTGKVTGKAKLAMNKIQIEKLQNTSPSQLLDQVKNHLDELPNPWESSLPEERPTVAHDEAGNVYIRTGVKKGQLQMKDITENAQSQIDEGLQAIYPEEKTLTTKEIAEGKQLRLALEDWRHLNKTEVQGRLNQIASDVKVLKLEERRLEGEITIKEQSGQASQNLIKRWRNTTTAIDALEIKRDMLEGGLGTTISEKGEDIKLRVKTLAKVFDNLEATAKRLATTKTKLAEAQLELPQVGFKKGAFQKEREIRKIQAGLLETINALTEDKGIRAAAKVYVNKVTTPEQALKAIEQIRAEVLKQETKKFNVADEADRAKTYNKVLALVEKKRVFIQSGHPTSKYPEALVNKLQTLKVFLKDKKEISKLFAQLAEEQTKKKTEGIPMEGLSDDMKVKLELANMAQAIHNGDPLTRNVKAAEIAEWIHDGDKIVAAKRAELQAKKDLTISTATKSLNVKKNPNRYAIQERNKFTKNINDIGAGWLTFNTLWDLMSYKDKNHTVTKLLDESESRNKYLKATAKAKGDALRSIQTHMEEHGDFKGNILQKTWDDRNTTVRITSAKPDGTLHTIEMTRAEMLDVALTARRPSMKNGQQKGNQFTFPGEVAGGTSTMERILGSLTPADNAQIEALLKFYPDYHPTVSDYYKSRNGISLPLDEGYGGQIHRDGVEIHAPFAQEGLQMYDLLPGSARNVTESTAPIIYQDPMRKLENYIDKWEYYKHYGELIDRLGHVMTDKDITSHIYTTYGSGTMQVLKDYVKRFVHNDPLPSGPTAKLFSAMHADWSNNVLAAKGNQFFIQLASATNTLSDLSLIDIAHGAKEVMLHPKMTQQAISQSPVFQQRMRSGANYSMQNALQSQGLFANTLGHIFNFEAALDDVKANGAYKRLMYSAHIGHEVSMQHIFGGILYHAELRKGATHEQAVIAAERVIEQTQTSSAVSQIPYWLTNPVVRTFTSQFAQQPLQTMGKSLVAVKDWSANAGSPKEFAILGGKLAALIAIPGAITAAVRSAPLWLMNSNYTDETQRELAFKAISEPIEETVGSAPIIGDIARRIWMYAAKPLVGVDLTQKGGLVHGNFMDTIYQDAPAAFKSWEKLIQTDDSTILPDITTESKIDDAFFKSMKVATDIAGLPKAAATAPEQAFKHLGAGDIPGVGLGAFSWSPSMMKKRLPSGEGGMDLGLESIDLGSGEQKESVYDTMKSYLNGLTAGTPPPESTETPHATSLHFVDEASK